MTEATAELERTGARIAKAAVKDAEDTTSFMICNDRGTGTRRGEGKRRIRT